LSARVAVEYLLREDVSVAVTNLQTNDGAPAAPMLDAVRALVPDIKAAADDIERDRHLPRRVVDAMARAGVFRLCVPRAVGGLEADPLTLLRVIETLARADGSAGWCAMIGATSGVTSAYLRTDVAQEIYGDPLIVTGGVFAPKGTAVAVDGGYRVSGRWPFASGCEHCAWLMGGSVIEENGELRRLANGMPDARMMLFPASDVRIIDTWAVAGLRGTGSHDIAVSDIIVPHERSVSLSSDRPCHAGPLFVFPVFGLLALGIAAVALGIARSAIEELTALAQDKTPAGGRRRLADRSMVQVDLAQAEAVLGAARAFVDEVVAETWDAAVRDGAIATTQRARLRLAATHATSSAAQVVDRMYNAGGGTSVYTTSLLQRHFRDVHVATQHLMVSPATYELVGRVLFGIDTDTSML
jgi:alkylation response protein AidB-like acyl-CoA dehydrogenase